MHMFYYRRIPRIRPWAYLFHKDISVGLYKNMGLYVGMGLYADTKIVLLKSTEEVRSTLLKTTVQTKATDDCVEMYKNKPTCTTYMVPPTGPWACTTKLCDVRTNPGLMREHGLIRGGAYPWDTKVYFIFSLTLQYDTNATCTLHMHVGVCACMPVHVCAYVHVCMCVHV